MTLALLLAAIFLAYANGSNDNFKGVATLFGSGTTDYKKALNWACWTTLAGSLAAVWVGQGLVAKFSGKGLIPNDVSASPPFLAAVGLGAAATVLVATFLGLPVSTTHALTGALVGAGVVHAAGSVGFFHLGLAFVLPLLTSPLLAMLAASGIYLLLRYCRLRLGVDKESCLCVGNQVVQSELVLAGGESLLKPISILQPRVDANQRCEQHYLGSFLGFSVARVLDGLHYLSAGAVCFARGLNDTPKIAALLVAGSLASPDVRFGMVALFIALGGWLSARRVARTMSCGITGMNVGQGFSANLVTAVLVSGASGLGIPVSTTHVSVGALFGIGSVSGRANGRMIVSIVLAWVVTLPLAALMAILFSFPLTLLLS